MPNIMYKLCQSFWDIYHFEITQSPNLHSFLSYTTNLFMIVSPKYSKNVCCFLMLFILGNFGGNGYIISSFFSCNTFHFHKYSEIPKPKQIFKYNVASPIKTNDKLR